MTSILTVQAKDFMYHGHSIEIDSNVNHEASGVENSETDEVNIDQDAILDRNGRTYHGYKRGLYFMPNDAEEQARLASQHELYLLVMDGRLGKAPVESARHVLDVATGTGIWATQYAHRYPRCQVTGTDLSQIQKEHSVPNCKFIRQDAENEEWHFDQKFDYIYFRYVVSCFNDMPTVMRKAFDSLAPGGWVEFYDTSPVMVTVDDTFRGTAAERWNKALLDGGMRAERDVLKAQKYAQWCKSIGFVDVTEELFPLPSNGKWPKNPKLKEIGKHNMKNLMSLVDSLTKFLELSGLTPEEILDLKREAKRDIQDGGIHFCAQIHIVYARKPATAS